MKQYVMAAYWIPIGQFILSSQNEFFSIFTGRTNVATIRLLTVGFHEMSHAFMGLLTCAKIHSVELDRKCRRILQS